MKQRPLLRLALHHQLAIVQRQIEPLEQLLLCVLQHVPEATAHKVLGVVGHALVDRIVLAIALAAQREVQLTDAIGGRHSERVQTLAELAVTVAVQSREEVTVGQIVARLAGQQGIAVVVRPAAPVHVRLVAQIVKVGGGVAGTAPFGACGWDTTGLRGCIERVEGLLAFASICFEAIRNLYVLKQLLPDSWISIIHTIK